MAELKYLADLHISPLTVETLQASGFTIQRVAHILSPRAKDSEIVALARLEDWVILTQDLDFSALVAKSGATRPSVISLRLEKHPQPGSHNSFCPSYQVCGRNSPKEQLSR